MTEFPVIRNHRIRMDANGLVSLTDIWIAAGKPKNQAPPQWGRYAATIRLKVALIEKLNMGKTHGSKKITVSSVYYAKGGEGGGTFADMRLALSYAESLNAKLALEVKEVFLRYKAADPTLADDVLSRATPEANEWAGKRALGRSVRRRYTDTLQAHGVAGIGYAQCTDAQYVALFDKKAKALKEERGLTNSGTLRDKMETKELVYIAAAEQLASDRIEDEKCQGNRECREASSKSAGFIREAIERDKADRQRRLFE